MRHAGLLLVKQPFFSKYHRILKEYIHELLKIDGIVQPTKQKMKPSGLAVKSKMRTPETFVGTQDVEVDAKKPQALFDTLTQVLVGAKPIKECIDMADFPLLAKLSVKFLTDYYLRGLQREFEKLGGIIESVDLANFVSSNNKV